MTFLKNCYVGTRYYAYSAAIEPINLIYEITFGSIFDTAKNESIKKNCSRSRF